MITLGNLVTPLFLENIETPIQGTWGSPPLASSWRNMTKSFRHPPDLKMPQIQILPSYMWCTWKITIHGVLLARGGLFCLKQCLGAFYGSAIIHMKYQDQGFPTRRLYCSHAQCQHFIYQWFCCCSWSAVYTCFNIPFTHRLMIKISFLSPNKYIIDMWSGNSERQCKTWPLASSILFRCHYG